MCWWPTVACSAIINSVLRTASGVADWHRMLSPPRQSFEAHLFQYWTYCTKWQVSMIWRRMVRCVSNILPCASACMPASGDNFSFKDTLSSEASFFHGPAWYLGTRSLTALLDLLAVLAQDLGSGDARSFRELTDGCHRTWNGHARVFMVSGTFQSQNLQMVHLLLHTAGHQMCPLAHALCTFRSDLWPLLKKSQSLQSANLQQFRLVSNFPEIFKQRSCLQIWSIDGKIGVRWYGLNLPLNPAHQFDNAAALWPWWWLQQNLKSPCKGIHYIRNTLQP